MRKEQAFALAAAGLLLTGCAKIEQESPKLSTDVATGTTELATEETSAAAQHPSVALQVPEITRQDVSMKLEAEDAAVPTGCSVALKPLLLRPPFLHLQTIPAEVRSLSRPSRLSYALRRPVPAFGYWKNDDRQ